MAHNSLLPLFPITEDGSYRLGCNPRQWLILSPTTTRDGAPADHGPWSSLGGVPKKWALSWKLDCLGVCPSPDARFRLDELPQEPNEFFALLDEAAAARKAYKARLEELVGKDKAEKMDEKVDQLIEEAEESAGRELERDEMYRLLEEAFLTPED